jgi:hypothetical protein
LPGIKKGNQKIERGWDEFFYKARIGKNEPNY